MQAAMGTDSALDPRVEELIKSSEALTGTPEGKTAGD
jgi:hypothetical protein